MKYMLVALLLAVGCGAVLHDRPGPKHTSWHEARSPHFIVRSDLDEDDLRGKVQRLEASWDALATIYTAIFPGRPRPDVRLDVIYFEDCSELWGDRIAYGGMVATLGDFSLERQALVCEPSRMIHGARQGEREVITHELAHHFNLGYVPAMPLWLQEGLASYLQSAEVDGSKVRFGGRNHMHQPQAGKPTVADLLAMKTTFDHRSRGYGNAWAFLHLLFDVDDYRARLLAYLNALADAHPWNEAWTATLGPVEADLQDAYLDHVHSGVYEIRAMPRVATTAAAIAMSDVSIDDVLDEDIRFAIYMGMSAQEVAALGRRIAALEATYPSWRRGDFWRAIAAARGPAPDDATVAALRSAAAAYPHDGRPLAAIVTLGLDRLGDDADLGGRAADAASLDGDARALLRIASRPGELLVVARYFAAAGKPSTGLNFAWRALEQQPGCDACEHTLGALLAQQGRIADAIAHEQRAIAIAVDGEAPALYGRRLTRYRGMAR